MYDVQLKVSPQTSATSTRGRCLRSASITFREVHKSDVRVARSRSSRKPVVCRVGRVVAVRKLFTVKVCNFYRRVRESELTRTKRASRATELQS